MMNKELLIQRLVTVYREGKGEDPSNFEMRMWSVMNVHRLNIEVEKWERIKLQRYSELGI